MLPSGGDNSYPGFIEMSPSHAVVSWYSSHDKDENGEAITGIYMADLVRGQLMHWLASGEVPTEPGPVGLEHS